MGMSINCGLMVGLMHDEILETGFDEDEFDEMICDGDLDIGSIYYDSDRDENVVGFWLFNDNKIRSIDAEELQQRITKQTEKFVGLFGVQPKLFVTLNVT